MRTTLLILLLIAAGCEDTSNDTGSDHDHVEGDEVESRDAPESNDPHEETSPSCRDSDQDGYPGSGDGCNPRADGFDCDDLNAEISPSAQEMCDSLDNDCDGLTDADDASLELPRCEAAEGVCIDAPAPCVDGHIVECGTADFQALPNYVAIEENDEGLWCDTLDNDCDGLVDEDILMRLCYTGPEYTEDVGICHGGYEACAEGGLSGICEGELVPRQEGAGSNCDELDNDCDGEIDEGCGCDIDPDATQSCYTGPPETRGVGACHDGIQRCPDRHWGPCEGDRIPMEETCTNAGQDDDCDGVVDNVPGQGDACDTGRPEPCAEGVMNCYLGDFLCLPVNEGC